MKMRPARLLFVGIALSVAAFSALGIPGARVAGSPATTRAAAPQPASVKPNPTNSLDCNGYSKLYPPVRPGLRSLCADPKAIGTGGYYTSSHTPGRFYDNGHYVGHDEPSVKFESGVSGSGNTQTYFLQLPQDPGGTPTTSPAATPTTSDQAELTPAFWFGLPLCDTNSFPSASGVAGDGVGGFHNCTPNSDSNAPSPSNQSTTGGGSAVLELQLYPPGYGPAFDGISCDATQYCAALNIDSFEAVCGGQPQCTSNPNCAEPVNYAFLTFDGVPTGPPSPQLSTYETYSPNADTLRMNQGDSLRVSIFNTSSGVETKIDDLTSGRSGFMIASGSNGFMHTDPGTCNGTPYNFQTEYDTASQGNLVPWAALEFGVLISNETGHFEPCASLTNQLTFNASFAPSPDTFVDNTAYQTCVGGFETQSGGSGNESCNLNTQTCLGNTEGNIACNGASHCELSDYTCFPSGSRSVDVNGASQTWSWPVAGCNNNQFQNGDLDFDGSSYIADWADGTPTHPTTAKFLGPFDNQGNEFTSVQFETNAPGSEQNCDFNTHSGCVVPPPGANSPFYPYWSIENASGISGTPVSTACVWNFGNDGYPAISDFSKDTQYGTASNFFPGTLISPVQTNPATHATGCLASETEANVAPPLPTVSGVSPLSGTDTNPSTLTVTGTNFSGMFNGTGYTTRSFQVGSTQVTTTCGAAPCFTVNTATSITLQLGPFRAGTFDITVSNPGGASVTNSSDTHLWRAFYQMDVVDGFGGIHSVPPSPAPSISPRWNFQAVRGFAAVPDGPAIVLLDASGGLYPYFMGAAGLNNVAYWPGRDVTRGVALLPDASGGVVLDDWGGLHPFGVGSTPPPTVHGSAYWPGWDIARGIVMRPDGTGGYVMDGWGGLHPFSVNNNPMPPLISNEGYWPGWFVVRGIALDEDGLGGYTLDAFGGLHPFGSSPGTTPPQINDGPYWSGWYIAKAVALHAGVTGKGWILDAWGGIHEWGAASHIDSPVVTPGAYVDDFLTVSSCSSGCLP